MRKFMLFLESREEAGYLLERSLPIAQALGASLTVLKACYDPLAELNRYIGLDDFEKVQTEILAMDRDWLAELIAGADTSGVDIGSAVQWSKRGYDVALTKVEELGVELIIKSAHVHNRLQEMVHMPSDWHLMREAGCPVLLLRPELRSLETAKGNGKRFIVAAVNPLEDEEAHHQLHVRVLDLASAMAKACEAPLKVVAAVPLINYATAYAAPYAAGFPEIQQDLKKRARKNLESLLSQYNITPDEILVEDGQAEDVLTQVCADKKAQMLVVGTVANKGVGAFFLGNTSERILHYANVDTLVVN